MTTTATIPVAYAKTTLIVNQNPQLEREFWLRRRDALLQEVDAIERAMGIQRTATLRRNKKAIDKTV